MRRAHAVCPFSVVADEYSLWNTIMLTNGAAKAWKELGIPILTYASLRCGFLDWSGYQAGGYPEGWYSPYVRSVSASGKSQFSDMENNTL